MRTAPAVPTTIAIPEDDARLRQRLEQVFEAMPAFELAASCPDLTTARERLLVAPPAVLLCDLELPDGHGTALISARRERQPPTAVLVFSVLGDERSVLGAIECEAGGDVLKDSSAQDIGGAGIRSPAVRRSPRALPDTSCGVSRARRQSPERASA